MSDARTNAPKIRFRGFTEDWEQRKLGEVIDIHSGRDYKHLNIGNIPVYGTGGYMLSVDKALSYEEDAIGIGRKGTIDRPYILKSPFWTVDTLFYAIPRVSYDIEFIYSIFQKINWKAKDESTGVPSLSKTVINSSSVYLPSSNEQQKIGTFFKQLDDTIFLHQCELDLLKQTKQTCLKKMFPKPGENKPEIRFAGFTDAWEQRKLSDIADKAVDNRGKTPTISEDENHPLLEVASLGNGAPDYSKVTKYLSDETFMAELRAYIKEGDILFSTVGSIGLVSLMDTNEDAAIAQNIVAFRANEKYDSKFLYAMLSTKDNQHKAQRIVMGAVQPSIKVSQLVDVDYCVTENIEEQRELGEYFLNLDNLITLHQRKLDSLKEMKKSLLQQMFV